MRLVAGTSRRDQSQELIAGTSSIVCADLKLLQLHSPLFLFTLSDHLKWLPIQV